MEGELEKFRQDWINEVQTKVSEVSKDSDDSSRALELFIAATKQEVSKVEVAKWRLQGSN
jgi:hypothetical protein